MKVAINGFGRIGRAFLKRALEEKEITIVAINDLATIENLAYLLRYDSAYGRSNLDIKTQAGKFIIEGREIAYFSEKDPTKLPWGTLGVDVVVESTGFFTSPEKAKVHMEAGAKRVVVSAPFEEKHEGEENDTVLLGINEGNLKTCPITSNASCTTNASSPVIQILHEAIGVEKAILSTVHAYTATQKLVDSADTKDWRRGRAGSVSIIPSTTGAAIAVTKAVPALEGLFDGISLRVPILTGSVADITFISKRDTTVEEVNEALKKASTDTRWKGVFTVTSDPIVSADIIGERFAAIADLSYTKVVGGNLVKVLSWYDNEAGYTETLVGHVIKTGQYVS